MTDGADDHPGDESGDLQRSCETEPIHIPGGVQPHGLLAVVDAAGIITCLSDNVSLLQLEHVVPGSPLSDLVGVEVAAQLQRGPLDEPVTVTIDGRGVYDVVTHLGPDGLLIEIEPESGIDLSDRRGLLPALRALQTATTTAELLDSVVSSVRMLTGFERVMVYEFDEEWNGSVVAEAVDPERGAFLGLRYPASDIPPQARALYLRNRVRLIPDVLGVPVPLLSVAPAPIDLTDATLRAVSPVHLEYLTNMGVAASASIAVIVRGQLWGLIACHHYSGPLRPSQRVRAALDVVAGTASALLAAHLQEDRAAVRQALSTRLVDLIRRLQDDDLSDPLQQLPVPSLIELVGADSVVVAAQGRPLRTAAIELDASSAVDLVGWLDALGSSTFETSTSGLDLPGELRASLPASVAGMLAQRWGGEGDWIVWFRDELVQSVRWGGDPASKQVVVEPGGARLGPRRSFDEYIETVRDTSEPWTADEVHTAEQLAASINEALTRQGRRDRSVATVMQRTLLLDSVPNIPGADVAVLYRPSGTSGLGGDWHDVYFLPDGRAVIAVGDVAGHGLEAAGSMAQLRHALRAYVMSESSLGAAVTRLSELSRSLLPGEMTTLAIATVDPVAGVVDMVNAGHLPPVLSTPSGSRLADLPGQPPIGIVGGVVYGSTPVVAGPGGSVVIYSDGLVERRGVDMDSQFQRLTTAIDRGGWSTSRAVCDGLFEQFAPDGSDDTTILVVRFPAALSAEQPTAE